MKVKDLMKALSDVDPEKDVILQMDAEGNGFRPAAGIDPECVFDEENEEAPSIHWDFYQHGYDKDDWDNLLQQPHCIVIYPV